MQYCLTVRKRGYPPIFAVIIDLENCIMLSNINQKEKNSTV